jgi:hypothetical protein
MKISRLTPRPTVNAKAPIDMKRSKYKPGDQVIINPTRAENYRPGAQHAIGTVVGVSDKRHDNRFVYLVQFPDCPRLLRLTAYDLRPSKAAPEVIHKPDLTPAPELTPTTRMMKVSLETAKCWYDSGNAELKQLALRLFSEKELMAMKPKTWGELCRDFVGKVYRRIAGDSDSENIIDTHCKRGDLFNTASTGVCMPTKELMSKYFALGKLIFLRYVWTGGWQPDWDNDKETKYVISTMSKHRWCILVRLAESRALYFRTHEDAVAFANAHKDLLKTAWGLY